MMLPAIAIDRGTRTEQGKHETYREFATAMDTPLIGVRHGPRQLSPIRCNPTPRPPPHTTPSQWGSRLRFCRVGGGFEPATPALGENKRSTEAHSYSAVQPADSLPEHCCYSIAANVPAAVPRGP